MDRKGHANDIPIIPVQGTQKTENYQVEVFLHCLNSTG